MKIKSGIYPLLFIFSILLFSSCGDLIINRRLDGKWKVLMINGSSLTTTYEQTYEFNREDGKSGKGVITSKLTANGVVYTDDEDFSYTLDDKVITVTRTTGSWTCKVTKHTGKSMVFSNIADNSSFIELERIN